MLEDFEAGLDLLGDDAGGEEAGPGYAGAEAEASGEGGCDPVGGGGGGGFGLGRRSGHLGVTESGRSGRLGCTCRGRLHGLRLRRRWRWRRRRGGGRRGRVRGSGEMELGEWVGEEGGRAKDGSHVHRRASSTLPLPQLHPNCFFLIALCYPHFYYICPHFSDNKLTINIFFLFLSFFLKKSSHA